MIHPSVVVRVLPLGGLGEIGMNCLALEQRGEVILVDCGVTFDDRGLGIDVVHPDFAVLDRYRDQIRGVLLTHGHEDHIGAVPHLLKRFDVPVFGPRYALGLLKARAAEHEVLRHAELREVLPRRAYDIGSFRFEPVRVTHSVADSTALAIETDSGLVVHTGDFKIDDGCTGQEAFDAERLAELGDQGVALLFSDSTNSDSEGASGSEATVGPTLERIVGGARGAVVVSTFASNVFRLRTIGAIALRTGRRVVLLGRSLVTHAAVARDTGWLEWPSDLVFPADRALELPRHRILAIATGSQGEPGSALARLARGEVASLPLGAEDTVVLSSRVIPGRERAVWPIVAELLRRGVDVRTWASDRAVHVSGHAHRDEQAKMLDLIRPRSFVPVHGMTHHLHRHAALARERGVSNVTVLENGDAATLDAQGLNREGRFLAQRIHVYAGRTIPEGVLRERMQLAADGIVVVFVGVDDRGKPTGDVAVTSRGVLEGEQASRALAAARREVGRALSAPPAPGEQNWAEIARLAARRAFQEEVGYKPVTLAQILRLGDELER